MHDQAASRISGRTRAAVSAMCVRAVRITVLKSAGNFTRDECHDLNAEKIQPVKCFMFTRREFVAYQQFLNAGAVGWVQKFQPMVNWWKWRFTSPCPVYLRKQTSIGRVGMSAGCQTRQAERRGRAARPQSAQMGTGSLACWHDQRYSVAYLRAISLTWSFVNCFGGTPAGLQVSRKKPSRPGGATIQSSSNS